MANFLNRLGDMAKTAADKTGDMIQAPYHHPNLQSYQCCRFFFRLFCNVLIPAETISAVPCHIMSCKNFRHFCVINVEDITISLYTACFLCIPESILFDSVKTNR